MYTGADTTAWYAPAVLSMVVRNGLENGKIDDDRLESAADVFLDELAERYDEALVERRLRLTGFYQRFHSRWQDAFETLEFGILVHEAAGVLFKHNHDLKYPSDEAKSYEYSALIILHARACQVSREVMTLIKGGYADGALARWRALYEMATVAEFIEEHGDETAERFLKYRIVETFRDGKKYEKYHEGLGFDPLEDGVIESLEEAVEELTDEFENSFKSHWGWAEQDLEEDTSRRRVAEEVGTAKFLPFYAMASNAVHGGSKGSQERLGLRKSVQEEVLPLGPSDVGFEDPAQLTSLMLHRVTAALLGLGEGPHWNVMVKGLEKIAHEMPGTFVAAPIESAIKESSGELAEAIVERVKEEIVDREGVERLKDVDVEEVDMGEVLEDVSGEVVEEFFGLEPDDK